MMFSSTTTRLVFLAFLLLGTVPSAAHAQRGSALPEDLPLLFEEGYRLAPGDTLCTTVKLGQLREDALFVPGTEDAVLDATRLPQDVRSVSADHAFSSDSFQESLDALWEDASQALELVSNLTESTEVCAVGVAIDSLSAKLASTLETLELEAEYAAHITANANATTLESLIVSGTESGIPVPVAIDTEVFQNNLSVKHSAAFFVPQNVIIPDPVADGADIVLSMDVLTYRVTRIGNYEPDASMSDYNVIVTGKVEEVGGITIPLPGDDDIVMPTAYRLNLEVAVTCIEDCGTGKHAAATADRFLFVYGQSQGGLWRMNAKLNYTQGAVAWGLDTGYVYGGATTATSREGLGLPQTAYLLGNYPNPFNPTTTIRYALPVGQDVHIAVYDALGRQVEVLTDGWQAAGEYHATFDATGQASGIYFYRITAGAQVSQTRIMTLVK